MRKGVRGSGLPNALGDAVRGSASPTVPADGKTRTRADERP